MDIKKAAMSGLFSLAAVPLAGMALTFGDSGWTMLLGVGVMFLGAGIVLGIHLARSKREFGPAEPEAPSEKISTSLVALSSAAILAIYSAGYLHTRPAASHFVEEAFRQRAVAGDSLPVVPEPEKAAPNAEAPASGSGSASGMRPKQGTATGTGARRKPGASVRPDVPAIAPSAAQTDPAASGGPADEPAAAANSPAPATPSQPADSATDSNREKSSQQNPPAAPSRPADAAPLPTGQASPAAAPQSASVRYKDGTYQGWGTCRHGDIQATVVIDQGKIASAEISKCYTRYPCDIISHLPGQVVTRQSVAVDYVSGATQSVYAFQDAVSAALAMAKRK